MTDALERRSTENNLGIFGDAQDADQLAGRGLNYLRDLFVLAGEEMATIARLHQVIDEKGLQQ